MDDLERIKAGLEEKKKKADAELEKTGDVLAEKRLAAAKGFPALLKRLVEFRGSVRKRVPVHLDYFHQESSINVSIGTNFPWLAKPDYLVRISSVSENVYDMAWLARKGNISRVPSKPNLDDVIECLSEFVADHMDDPKAFEFTSGAVLTYMLIGGVFGLPVAFITYLKYSDSGMFGALFGLVAAGVAFAATLYIWPIFLVIGLWLLVR